MKTIEEQIDEAKNKLNILQKQKRLQEKQKKEAQKKINQRRFYIIGEIVCNRFPQLLQLAPGNKQENTETFKNFDIFLKFLSEENELCAQIYEKAKVSLD